MTFLRSVFVKLPFCEMRSCHIISMLKSTLRDLLRATRKLPLPRILQTKIRRNILEAVAFQQSASDDSNSQALAEDAKSVIRILHVLHQYPEDHLKSLLLKYKSR